MPQVMKAEQRQTMRTKKQGKIFRQLIRRDIKQPALFARPQIPNEIRILDEPVARCRFGCLYAPDVILVVYHVLAYVNHVLRYVLRA